MIDGNHQEFLAEFTDMAYSNYTCQNAVIYFSPILVLSIANTNVFVILKDNLKCDTFVIKVCSSIKKVF